MMEFRSGGFLLHWSLDQIPFNTPKFAIEYYRVFYNYGGLGHPERKNKFECIDSNLLL